MVRTLPVITAAVAIFAMGLSMSADAQQKIARIPKEKSRIILNMPGLQDGRDSYGYAGWNEEFSKETSIAFVRAGSGNYPRALVFMQELAPDYVWRSPEPFEPEMLKRMSTFLQQRDITILNDTPAPTDDFLARTIRFTVDNTDCLGFSVLNGAPGPKGENGATAVLGYYCSAAGVKLSDGDMRSILAGWKIVEQR